MYRPTALPRRSRPPRRPSARGPGGALGAEPGSGVPPWVTVFTGLSPGVERCRWRPPPEREPLRAPDPPDRPPSVSLPSAPAATGAPVTAAFGRAGRVSPIFGRSTGGRGTTSAASGTADGPLGVDGTTGVAGVASTGPAVP